MHTIRASVVSLFGGRKRSRNTLVASAVACAAVFALLPHGPGGSTVGIFALLASMLLACLALAFSFKTTKERAAEDRLKPVTGAAGFRADVGLFAGGAGVPLRVGVAYTVRFYADGVTVGPDGPDQIWVPFVDMLEAHATGAGTVRTGGWVAGGGFGLEGAVEGVLIATVLNGLLTKTRNDCVLRIATTETEMTFALRKLTPAVVDSWLAPARVAQRNRQQVGSTVADAAGQLERLAQLHATGALTDEEFSEHKARLLRSDRER